MTGAGVLSIIICKISYQEEFGSIVLLKVDKNPKISFHNTILTFCLAVSFGVKNNKKVFA